MRTDRGSVRWHRGGWEVRVQIDGRRATRRVRAANNRTGRRAAEAALDALVTRLDTRSPITVSGLLDRYTTARAPDWSPSTMASHLHHRRPLDDAIGPAPVDELTPVMLEGLYARWVAAGQSPGTVRRRHAILSAAYRHAERWGVVVRSPTAVVRLPTVRGRRLEDLPPAVAVLAALERLGHRRLAVAARLAVATGARRGELVGLRWADVDLEAGAVIFSGSVAAAPDGTLVRKGLKSGGPKVLTLDASTVGVLRAWRPETRRMALAAGHRLVDRDLVLCAPTAPVSPWAPAPTICTPRPSWRPGCL